LILRKEYAILISRQSVSDGRAFEMDVRIMVRKAMLLPELLVLVALIFAQHVAWAGDFPYSNEVVIARPQFYEPPEKDYGFEDWSRLLGRNASQLDQDLEESIRLCTETIQLAQACDQPTVVAIAMMQRASARASLEGIEAGNNEFRRALELYPLSNHQNYQLFFTHALFQHQRVLGLSHTIFVPIPPASELTMPTPNGSREIRCRLVQDLLACWLEDGITPDASLLNCSSVLSSQVKSDVQTRHEILMLRCEVQTQSTKPVSEFLQKFDAIRQRPEFVTLSRDLRISTLLLIANLEKQSGKDSAALLTLEEALKLARELKHQTIIAMCQICMIQILQKQDNHTQAQSTFEEFYNSVSAINCPDTLRRIMGAALNLPAKGTGVHSRQELRKAVASRIRSVKTAARLTSQTLGEWNASRASRMLAMQSERITAAQLRADEESRRSLRFTRIGFAVFCGLAVILLRERRKLRNANRRLKEEILHTEQQRQETERIELRLAQTERLESLGALAGGIAHDFNNLLVGVIGNADLMKYMEPGSPAGSQCLEGIIRSAETAAGLSRKMLAYAGKQPATKKILDLNDSVNRILPLLRAGLGGRHSILFDPDPIPLQTEGDAEQIDQILLNLVTNAAQAMIEVQGTILIRTGCDFLPDVPVDTPTFGNRRTGGEFVWFEVIDSGKGIAESDFARVFQPFFSTRSKPDGHGFGLSVVYGHVNRHDGLIQLTSFPGEGSRFRILLPRSAMPTRSEPVCSHPSALSTISRATRIVAVDDQTETLEVIGRTIELIGGKADLFTSATEALEHLVEHKEADCLLLDLLMSPLDGPSMLEVLHSKGIHLPVILMTGCSTDGILAMTGDFQVHAVLQKPFRPEELITLVNDLLVSSKSTTAPSIDSAKP
jgi:signal transduction histidine kinase/tetratricopeptide (TPR) repeat protein